MSQRVARSLTLLWALVATAAIVLAIGGVVLGSIMSQALRQQSLDDTRVSLSQYTSGVLSPRLVYGTQLRVGEDVTGIVRRTLAERPDILSVKVWRRDGVLAWASLAPDRIGQRFPVGHDLQEVFESGEAEAGFEDLADAEDAVESRLPVNDLIEVYAPVISGSDEVIGAYEVYADATPLEASIADRKHELWIAIGAVFVLLWILLLALARSASSTLRRQTTALRERSVALSESYRRLEESSLEAIESLNATVEAKDPYTAGHSIRVQRIAVSIGRELGLTVKEMDALRFGALFHDIGKIAIPDDVLGKPGPLTDEERRLMQTHTVLGAQMLGGVAFLRDGAVDVVRSHHERWDGTGYPDGLRGEEVPFAARIFAVADALDAMTSHRPYRESIGWRAARREIVGQAGTQFDPEIVSVFCDREFALHEIRRELLVAHG
jgi:putative nucleotidyltransferase with HDIG domain